MVLKNLLSEGGKVLKNSGPAGPELMKTDIMTSSCSLQLDSRLSQNPIFHHVRADGAAPCSRLDLCPYLRPFSRAKQLQYRYLRVTSRGGDILLGAHSVVGRAN